MKIEEAADQTRWREDVRAIAEGTRCIWATFENEEEIGLKLDDDELCAADFECSIIT